MTIQHARAERRGLAAALVVCGVVGAAVVGVTLSRGQGPNAEASPAPPAMIATEEYGRRLIRETPELLGPDHPNPERRMISSRLACASCHLNVGAEPGTLTLLQTDEHFPRFSGRAGAMTDIEDRINECMTRSMNGQALPMDSPEMIAMAAYLRSLGAQYDAMGASSKASDEPPAFKTPDRRADPIVGQTVYTERCAICHGVDGAGLMATGEQRKGFLFPPLWGPNSFNDGAGMARIITASRFIKTRMPLGQPDLTDDQTFDVAAYIVSQPRPAMPNLDRDYPDRTLKPVDNGYGPYADTFPQDQHKYGPFKPIEDYYKSLRKPGS